MSLVQLARRVRHAPVLHRAEPLWSALRPFYYRALDPLRRGVPLKLAGRQIRVPPELFAINPDWSRYETESFAALGEWLDRHHAGATLIDIGCSVGVVTSFSLQLSPRLQAIAFDSSAMSLRAMEAVVPARAGERLRRVCGLLGEEHEAGETLETAAARTRALLPTVPARTAISQSGFVCFGEESAAMVPHYRLDALIRASDLPDPILLKCDVEGAELLVLKGAVELLEAKRPHLLLSVHPKALPQFGHTLEQVAAFLENHGYRWRVLARDHEEHWLAEPG